MFRTHHEERSLEAWLVMQERVLRLWIEEALGDAPSDGAFVRDLETHHRWLKAQIARLSGADAA